MNFWKHKKFRVGILASLFAFIGQVSSGVALVLNSPSIEPTLVKMLAISLDGVDWYIVLGPILVAIGAQGISDFGKESASELNKAAGTIQELKHFYEQNGDQKGSEQ